MVTTLLLWLQYSNSVFLCYSVVAIGGDGTASRVISAVLNKSQEMQGVEKRQHFTPVKPPVTFGIIPTGNYFSIKASISQAINMFYGCAS